MRLSMRQKGRARIREEAWDIQLIVWVQRWPHAPKQEEVCWKIVWASIYKTPRYQFSVEKIEV